MAKSSRLPGRPKRLSIQGKRYKVASLAPEAGLLGRCDSDSCTIFLMDGMEGQQERDTLLHEALHAIDSELKLDFTEQQVHALASSLYALFNQNKQFAKWFLTY